MSKQNNFKWTGEIVNCYNPVVKNKNHIFHTSFIFNGESFLAGDFAIILNETNDDENRSEEICRLLCVYESQEKRHVSSKYKALVRRYTWAKEILRFKQNSIAYDEENEIVEDYNRLDFIINLQDIIKKCYVIFSTIYDPVDYIASKELDKKLYFSCRYKLISSKLITYFSNHCLEQISSQECTPFTQLIKQETNTSPNNYFNNISLDREKASNNNKQLTPNNNSVKRNLNISFGDTHQANFQENSLVLNYSIVEKDTPENDSLKLRLKLSTNQPVVVLDKLELENDQSLRNSPSKRPKRVNNSNKKNIRRSSRVTRRVSYVELFSPCIPTKRGNPKSDDYNKEVVLIDTKLSKLLNKDNNETKKLKSTKKSTSKYFYYESLSSESDNEEIDQVTGKRKIKSPFIKSTDEIYLSPVKVQRTSTITKTPVKQKLEQKKFKSTPTGNKTKLIRDGTITPSIQSRKNIISLNNTPLMLARTQLHVSFVPDDLPCREKEYSDIFTFLESKLLDKCGGCMYISGVPGTGKTATTTSVINHLLQISKTGDLPQFQYVNINGMKLTEPRQSYVEILKQLTGKTVPKEQAQAILEEKFTKSKKKQLPVVLLVDELDIICTKRQDVVYNLLDWPTKASTQLVVITIANTMDLPERLLMSRVTSRLGLTRLTFQAYTHKQLQEIVTKRLMGINSFNPDAIQFVARKVASVSGDARRALDICRRSAEIAELTEGKNTLVTMTHVNEALKAMLTQPKVCAIKSCSKLEKFILQAVVAEVERTGVEETTFADVFKMLVSILALNGFPLVTGTIALSAISKLCTCRLLLSDQKCSDIHQRIILNISPDDVYYALKHE